MKYKLTNNTKQIGDTTLYQIQALKDFSRVRKGDLGGWIEKESNLSQDDNSWVYDNARVYGNAMVYDNAMVCGDARVYGDAKLCGKYNYTKGKFIGGDDSCKITNITDKTGNVYWKAQYVLGDYKITPQEVAKDIVNEVNEEITLNGKRYRLIK